VIDATADQLSPLDVPQLYVPPEMFINRELSWLAFNERVLALAEGEETPLLERVKFLAIFSANLDEFFMIRVASVRRKLMAGIVESGVDGISPQALASAIRHETQRLLDQQAAILNNHILPALGSVGIKMVSLSELGAASRARLTELFSREIFPVLTPQAIDRGRRFPHVSNQSLNVLVQLGDSDAESELRFARVKVPAVLDRLIAVPEHDDDTTFVWLEDLVASEIGRLFPGNQVLAVFPFHVNRDSDIELDDLDDDGLDLLNQMERQLSQRTFGAITQLLVDETMPEAIRAWLVEQLHATKSDLYIVNSRLALESLFELSRLDRPELKDPPLIPAPLYVRESAGAEPVDWNDADVFTAIRNGDVMIHHPYQSFAAVTRFLSAASRDSNVVAIKQTLYRLGKDSPIIPLLVEARDDDTQVAVLMEVKARFDEENNIALAHELETAGVHVNYGLPGLKTHCKAMLIVRREPEGLRRYVHLSTGNYNAATARIYEDFAIFTAREDVAADVSELFNVLTGYSRQEHYRTLLVAPRDLRSDIIRLIDREIELHEKQSGGRIIFKMNSLVDREIIRALYRASMVGVEIELIVRGICCLRPGVPGWSETIRVRSIVGRFLEHSRMYYFANGGEDEIYLGSADMMERNLDRRVEVVFPVALNEQKSVLRDDILAAYLKDTANAQTLGADGKYQHAQSQPGATEAFDVHRWLTALYRR
jgi:polyphosphate kinase